MKFTYAEFVNKTPKEFIIYVKEKMAKSGIIFGPKSKFVQYGDSFILVDNKMGETLQ